MAYYERLIDKGMEFPMDVFLADNNEKNISSNQHWHDCFEILYTMAGKAVHYINEIRYDTVDGDIIFVKSGDIHSTLCEVHDNTQIMVVKFMPDLIEEYSILSSSKYIASFLNFQNNKVVNIPDDTRRVIEPILLSILNEYHIKDNAYELFIKGYIFTLIGIFVRNQIIIIPKKNNPEDMRRICEIIEFMENNYSTDILLSDISKKLNMNYSYTSRYFKKITGRSFKEYFDFIKICEADKMITRKNFSLGKISQKCGYSSLQSFSRAYKRIKGYSPNQKR